MKTESQIRDASKLIGMLSASLAELTERKAPTFGEFAKTVHEQKMASSELRDSTKRAWDYQYRTSLPAFSDIPLDKFGNADWIKWVREMQGAERKRITRFFNARKAIVEVLNAALEQGVIERKPRLDNPDEKRNVGRVITDQETWWILRHTTYRIFRVFFYGLYKQGVRPREMLKWERSMIKTGPDGRMWVEVPARITKTARSRLMPVNQTLAKHICRIMKENPDSRFVFQNRIHPDSPQLSFHGAFKTACGKVRAKHPEFKKCVPYDWRRSFITRAMVKGKPPVYIAQLLDTSVGMLERVYTKEDKATLEALVE
jgi:integrase